MLSYFGKKMFRNTGKIFNQSPGEEAWDHNKYDFHYIPKISLKEAYQGTSKKINEKITINIPRGAKQVVVPKAGNYNPNTGISKDLVVSVSWKQYNDNFVCVGNDLLYKKVITDAEKKLNHLILSI